jgi:hypothetical protein
VNIQRIHFVKYRVNTKFTFIRFHIQLYEVILDRESISRDSVNHLISSYVVSDTDCLPFSQAIATFFSICLFSGSLSLYATSVCVACSQLEKLTATLLDIRQPHVISVQNNGQKGQSHISEDVFLHMQKQLNACIRHHQEIHRYGYCHHSNQHPLHRDIILFNY